MPPQQAPYIAPPNNPYDFINSYNHRRGNWLLEASFKTRLIIVSGGLVVLLLLTWIVAALLTSGGSSSAQNLTALASEQVELARISDSAYRNASGDAAENLASTTKLSVLSDELSIVSYLGNLGVAPSRDALAKGRNLQTDAQLAAAQNNGTYDQTYITIATGQLQTYSSNLKKAFAATSNPSERQFLSNAYEHAQLLLTLSQESS